MYRMYAADPRARINLGIRRRLAPLMENDRDRIKLMNSLLLSMPGSPIIYYGDEIGMGDNIFLGDRNGVRTPMQWSPDRNAGFSRADPQRLYLPPIMDPVYGYEAVNVEAQTREPVVAAQLDAAHAGGAQGEPGLRPRQADLPQARQPQDPRLPARVRRRDDPVRRQPRPLGAAGGARPGALSRPRAGGDDGPHRLPADRRAALPADPARLRLLLVPPRRGRRRAALARGAPGAARTCRCWCCSTAGPAFSATASCPGASAWPRRLRAQFETETLPRYIADAALVRRQGRADQARAPRATGRCGRPERTSWLLALLRGRERRRAGALLRCRWRSPGRTATRSSMRSARRRDARARCASRRNVGVLGDAFADEAFCRAVVEAIGAGREMHQRARAGCASRRPRRSPRWPARTVAKLPWAGRKSQSSNTVVTLGERLFLKGYRRARPGVNPEFEVGRFLTEVAHFPNCVPVAGALEYIAADGTPTTPGAAAGLCRQPGRRLELHARLPRALLRGAAHRRRAACLGRRTAPTCRWCTRSARAPRSCTRRLPRRAATRPSTRSRSPTRRPRATGSTRVRDEALATLRAPRAASAASSRRRRATRCSCCSSGASGCSGASRPCAMPAGACARPATTATTTWARCW